MEIEIGGVYNFTNKEDRHPPERNRVNAIIILGRPANYPNTYGNQKPWDWSVCDIIHLFELRDKIRSEHNWCVMENELTPVE